jgi:CelD/BcsL family acetyltransferase involved in cellulose biosynthesis
MGRRSQVIKEYDMTESFEQYHLSIVPISEYSSSKGSYLSKDWSLLEESAEANFFLSWSWIGAWLESYTPNADVLSVHYKGELVALSLLCKSSFSSWKRFTTRRLHINQTGDPVLDQIWTEYNGILCSSVHEPQVQVLLMPFLVDHYAGWDELQVGAITQHLAKTLHESSGLTRLDLWHSPSYGVDLDVLTSGRLNFLDSLSRNSRYQIRRSLKLYAEEGGIKLQFAQTEQDAQLFFNEIAPLHMKKWGTRPGESGFSNPAFLRYHQNLIKGAFPLGQVDLIKISCGERVLGYIYNFLYKGRVYFYLSGLVSEPDSKLKPGLCAHALSIQHYMDKGYRFYDFMGGQDRYKSNLGKVHEELYHISLQKPHLKFKIESFLRGVKQHLVS